MHPRNPLLVLALLLPASALAAEMPLRPADAGLAASRAASLSAPGIALEAPAPLAELQAAAVGAADRLDAVARWNADGGRPIRTGFVRELPVPARAVLSGGAPADGLATAPAAATTGTADAVVWGAIVRVEGAYRLRLHLAELALPAGTQLWVYGVDGPPRPFDLSLAHEESLWTPSVAGEEIRLEVRVPAGSGGSAPAFVVDALAEEVELDQGGMPRALGERRDTSCLVRAACVDAATFPAREHAAKAIGQLSFIDGYFQVACSGGLLNNTAGPGGGPRPYLLTANHCIDDPRSAASLEVTWDYTEASCGGPPADPSSLPRSNGSSLLATGVVSDFTLLELADVPAGRAYLGWTTELQDLLLQGPPPALHRISHPVPSGTAWSQVYTRSQLRSDPVSCASPPGQSINGPDFLRHREVVSGTFGGSSGAPMMLGDGRVVGQEYAACPENGADPKDGCDDRNVILDGAFATTYRHIAGWLSGEQGPAPPGHEWLAMPAFPGYSLQMRSTNARDRVVSGFAAPDCVPGTFCVATHGDEPQLLVRILGPRRNGYVWVFLTRFSTARLEVWVREDATGIVRYYDLPAATPGSSDLDGLFDRDAFPAD